MPLLDVPSLGGNARHVLRQYAEESALARGRAANAAGTEEFGGGCLRGRYNNLREVIQNNPSLVVVPSIINAGSLFVQRPICRTNYLPNNSMAGATGSVLPTNWSIASLPAGITVSYSASGTAVASDGTSVNYIDVTVSGTAGASGFLNIRPNLSSSTIAAFVGQTWNTSVYLQLISGSVASISPTWQLQELNSSQTFLQGSNIGGLGSLVVGGQFERYNVSRVLTDSATAFVTCRWGHSFVSGTTYSYTLRIGSPQLERFSVPTPMIATSTGAVTRLNESTNVVGLPPDFTVSRNTGATRVGPNGLIEAGNTNLAFHSESWASGNNWGLLGLTNATGAIAAPNGTITANALSPTAVSGSHFMTGNNSTAVSYTSGTIYTQSAFFKAGTGAAGQLVQLTFTSAAFTQGGYANFDLNAGTVSVVSGSSADANRAAKIENYGNGWYRCIFTATCNITGTGVSLIPVLITASGSGRTPSFTGVTGDILYAWGAQLEVGSTASEYIPTTTVARTRFAGVTVDGTIAANIPRIDWLGQSCPALLVEPAATNQIRNNSMVGAVTGSPGTLPTNWGSLFFGGLTRQIVATGVINGIQYIDIRLSGTATEAGGSIFFDTITASSGQVWTSSFWFDIISQPNPANGFRFQVQNRLATVFVSDQFATLTPAGFIRYQNTTTVPSGVDNIRPCLNVQLTVGQSYDFTIRIGYPQMEQSSFATSVIPTTSGTVSRAADVISASGALVSGLIGQTEGTIYAEVDVRVLGDGRFVSISDGTTNNRIQCRFNSVNNGLDFVVVVSGAVVGFSISNSTHPSFPVTISSGTYKIALGYKQNDYVVAMNGVTYTPTVTTRNVPLNFSKVTLGADVSDLNQFNNRIRAAALYTTRLSNAQLAELTRL